MGYDSIPSTLNLFSHYCEGKWVYKLKKSSLLTARIVRSALRFIDDLTVINDGKKLCKISSKHV